MRRFVPHRNFLRKFDVTDDYDFWLPPVINPS
jgi:hypothetical protein